MKLYDFLCDKNRQSYTALVNHKFARDLVSGKLPWKSFFFYLVQDHIFIEEYLTIIKKLQKKAQHPDDKQLIESFMSTALNEEIETFTALIPQETIWKARRSLATLAYIGYLYEIAANGDFLDLLIALIPCPLSYDDIAARLGEPDPLANEVYKKWVYFYQDQKTRSSVAKLRQLISAYDSDNIDKAKLSKLQNIFSYIINLEIKFFDQAYLCEEC